MNENTPKRGTAIFSGIRNGVTVYTYTAPNGTKHEITRPAGSKRWHGVPLDYMRDCYRALAVA